MFLAPNGKRYYSVSEVASITGYHSSTIYKWCKKRKLKVYKYWIDDKKCYMWGIDTRALNEIKEETK